MKSSRIPFFAILLILCSCGQFPFFQTPTLTPSQTPTITLPTKTVTPTPIPTRTPYPTATPTPTPVPISWRDLSVFLANDHTNWNVYNKDTYTCVNFAVDLVINAHKQNIDAWLVSVNFDRSETGHAFVAFQTTDLGEVWIEPQSDYSYFAVDIGKPLCLTVDTSICQNWGRVTRIWEHAQCNVITSECWSP